MEMAREAGAIEMRDNDSMGWGCEFELHQLEAFAKLVREDALAQPEPVQEPSGFFRREDACGDEVGPPVPYYLTPPAPVQEWMKPNPKCDEACLFQCTKGFTQFPECAATPPAQPAPGDIRALKHRIHELEGEVLGYKQMFDLAEEKFKGAPVPNGWKLVPVEPTREMWTAVNKLDDQCAAGNYDGKGCSIQQAWNCLLDAAPTPPAQPAPVQEPVGWMEMVVTNLVREGVNKHKARALAEHFYTTPPAQPAPYIAVSNDRMTIDPHTGYVSIGTVAQRTWVGLSDEEADEIYASVQEEVNEHWDKGGTTMMFPLTLYKAIETRLKDKNNAA
jgi:hypothetical protein